MKFAISTCEQWLPERRATLTRLLEQLPKDPRVRVFSSRYREPSRIWAARLWEWAAESDEDTVCLNDDAIVCPNFAEVCEAMAEAVPDEVLSLHTQPTDALELAKRGHHWVRCYWQSGVAYLIPGGHAQRLLDFWGKLPWSFASRINEDHAGILAAWDIQKPCWMPIPAPVKHDTSVKSSLGYDGHPMRSTCVGWEDFPDARMTDPEYWKPREEVPTIQNPWMPIQNLVAVRQALQTGTSICFACTTRPGDVGPKDGAWSICRSCTAACAAALIEGRTHDQRP